MRELKERYEVINKLSDLKIKIKHKFCGCEVITTMEQYERGQLNCNKHFYMREECEARDLGLELLGAISFKPPINKYKLKCGCEKRMQTHDLFRGKISIECKIHNKE